MRSLPRALLFLMPFLASFGAAHAAPPTPQPGNVVLGVRVNPEKLMIGSNAAAEDGVSALEAQIGRKLAIDHDYERFDWTELPQAVWDVQNHRTPMISWQAGRGEGDCATAADIPAGRYA